MQGTFDEQHLVTNKANTSRRPSLLRPDADRLPLVALLVLAAAMFAAQLSEFMLTGLLPLIAGDLDRPITAVGLLVTVFATAVVLTTIPGSVITRRLPRRPVLLGALGGISAAAALAAVAPSFPALVAARALAGVFNGLFWTVAGAYAAYLVPSHRLGRAMAITGIGGAVAAMGGQPLSNAIGQWVGWRWSFASVAAVTVVVIILAGLLLPAVDQRSALRLRPRFVWDRTLAQVLSICMVLIVVVGGAQVFGPYTVPWLEEVVGLGATTVPLYLMAAGIAGTAGIFVMGVFFDRSPRSSFAVAGVIGAAALGSLAVLGPRTVTGAVAIGLLWGASFACLPAMLQARVMQRTSAEARPLAAALQTTAVNLGIGAGAAVGGLTLGAVSLAALPAVGAAVLAAGVALHVVTDRKPEVEFLPDASSIGRRP